ncbi:MAG: hypothetical protein ACRCW2_14940 [Cellulosilyticaceae bacterium]
MKKEQWMGKSLFVVGALLLGVTGMQVYGSEGCQRCSVGQTCLQKQVPGGQECLVIPRAKIIEVDTKLSRVTVLPKGLKDTMENYIILNVSDQTVITHQKEKKIYTLADLQKGMIVKVSRAAFQTASIPPQTTACEIVILRQGVCK